MRRQLLLDKDIRRITAGLREAGWTVESTGDNKSYLCTAPEGKGSVILARSTSRTHFILKRLRELGYEADPRRRSPVRAAAVRPTRPVFSQSIAEAMPNGVFYQQAPLLAEDLSNLARGLTWSEHVLERCNERNIGVFEVVNAIYAPDKCVPAPGDSANVVHLIRGDVGVVYNKADRTVITVLDLNNRPADARRVALHPTIELPVVPTPEENPMTPTDVNLATPEAGVIRHFIGQLKKGDEITVAYLVAELPQVARHNISYQLQWLTAKGLIAPTGVRGKYSIVNPAGIRAKGDMGVVKVENAVESLVKARQVLAEGGPTARKVVDEFLTTMRDDEEFLLRDALDVLTGDFARQTLANIFREYMANGVLQVVRADVDTRSKVLRRAGVGHVSTLDDEDFVPVSTGFEFTPLPASEVVELAGIVRSRMTDLRANPHRWAQIALYEATSTRPIENRMHTLEKLIDNPDLQFTVRQVLEGKVGMFVRLNAG